MLRGLHKHPSLCTVLAQSGVHTIGSTDELLARKTVLSQPVTGSLGVQSSPVHSTSVQ